MVNIKSLKRIAEAVDSADTKYANDIKAAKKTYEKVEDESKTWLGTKPLHWSLSTNKKLAEAAKDKSMAIDAAEVRRKAAKSGMTSKQDLDDAKFEAAKAKHVAISKTSEKISKDDTGIVRKISGAVSDHPYLAAGTVAGLAALVALQKRKKRDPEPGQY